MSTTEFTSARIRFDSEIVNLNNASEKKVYNTT